MSIRLIPCTFYKDLIWHAVRTFFDTSLKIADVCFLSSGALDL